MYKVVFEWGSFTVTAKCKDINQYMEAIELSLKFEDSDGNSVFDIDYPSLGEVEVTALEELYDKKYTPELEIG